MGVLVEESAFNLLDSVMASNKNEAYYEGLCPHRRFSCRECNIPPRDKRGEHLCEHGRSKYKCPEQECKGAYGFCVSLKAKAKQRAKSKNIPCTLTACDIFDLLKITGGVCPVLGLKFKYNKVGFADNSPSIDRHVPEKGYTKENCSIISWLANRLKSNGTAEQLQKVADYAKMVQGI